MDSITGEAIRTARKERGLSRKSLAKTLGVSLSTVIRYEKMPIVHGECTLAFRRFLRAPSVPVAQAVQPAKRKAPAPVAASGQDQLALIRGCVSARSRGYSTALKDLVTSSHGSLSVLASLLGAVNGSAPHLRQLIAHPEINLAEVSALLSAASAVGISAPDLAELLGESL